jgi:uncharacterized protein (DUF1015 family)
VSALFPFRALRPDPAAVAAVASVPYDVVSADEARALAAGNSRSFLHVTRSDIDLPAAAGAYDPAVYAQAVRNFEELKRSAPLLLDEEPALYVYRLRMGRHEQVGLSGCFSLDEYERGLVKKHEKTRPDKEDDRTRHITALRAQTGLVFLTYRASPTVGDIVGGIVGRAPLYDFTAADGVQHTLWRIVGSETDDLVRAFRAIDALYIADGHHRAASAARAHRALGAAGRASEAGRFVAVAFPDNQLQVLPYHRVMKDLAGQTPESFLAALRAIGPVRPGPSAPSRRGEVSMYLAGRWYSVDLPPAEAGAERAEALDVSVLQERVLEPLLHVGDPRTDGRIDFVGGIRGTEWLERLVRDRKAAVAFSMFPVSIEDLMAVADTGGIMPPKSTWFEPKLRDGILVHLV